MRELLTLEIELKNEIMTTVRLATGGVSSLAGLSYDDGEDCKVCVTESLLLLSHRGYTRARISFLAENGLTVSVEGAQKTAQESDDGDEISVALLSALAQDVSLIRSTGTIEKIGFRFANER